MVTRSRLAILPPSNIVFQTHLRCTLPCDKTTKTFESSKMIKNIQFSVTISTESDCGWCDRLEWACSFPPHSVHLQPAPPMHSSTGHEEEMAAIPLSAKGDWQSCTICNWKIRSYCHNEVLSLHFCAFFSLGICNQNVFYNVTDFYKCLY